MSEATKSANNAPLVSRTAARGAFGDALRLYVGRGRRYTVKQLSNGSGVADRVIECALCDPESHDYRQPDMGAQLSLIQFIGPEFTTEWLKMAGQGAFWLPDLDDTPPGEMAADLSDGAAAVVRRALDGELCPEDRRQLRPVGRRLISLGAQLAA